MDSSQLPLQPLAKVNYLWVGISYEHGTSITLIFASYPVGICSLWEISLLASSDRHPVSIFYRFLWGNQIG